jgi:hypothetical protein
MRRLLVAVALALAVLIAGCGLKLPDQFELPTGPATANPALPIETSFAQFGHSLSVRLRNPNPDAGLVRSPFELALIDRAGAVIATEGQGGLPGTPVNTIYQLPPGGEYGLDSVSIPNGRTVASVELTILGQWFRWDAINPPVVTVTDAVISPDSGYSGPSVTGRLTLDKDGPLNVVVMAFVETSAGTVVSRLFVDCAQSGQRRTFRTKSYAFDARGPYRLDKIVAYATSIEDAGPKFDPGCAAEPASTAPPAVTSIPRTTAPTPSPQSPSSSSAAFPSPPTNASTSDVSAPRRSQTAHLAAVRLEGREGRDRLVFEFTDRVPGYRIGYRPLPMQKDASGADIPLPGANAAVRISLSAATAAGWDNGARTYFGPPTVTGDTAVVTEAKEAGDFEAVLTWVVGLEAEVPFQVLVRDAPPRLVIDFERLP